MQQTNWELVLGPFGALVICLAAMVMLWRKLQQKDEQLSKEHESRLTDSRQYAETLLRVAEATHQAIDRLNGIAQNDPPPARRTGTNPRG